MNELDAGRDRATAIPSTWKWEHVFQSIFIKSILSRQVREEREREHEREIDRERARARE
jgi:hypothetical protein